MQIGQEIAKTDLIILIFVGSKYKYWRKRRYQVGKEKYERK